MVKLRRINIFLYKYSRHIKLTTSASTIWEKIIVFMLTFNLTFATTLKYAYNDAIKYKTCTRDATLSITMQLNRLITIPTF